MEIKMFNIQDGMGITLAKAAGFQVGVITGRKCEAVQRRCSELDFDIILQDCPDKMEGYHAIKQKFGYADDEIAYIGDDIQDLPVLQCVGVPLGVSTLLCSDSERLSASSSMRSYRCPLLVKSSRV